MKNKFFIFLILMILTSLFVVLGFWQLNRAKEKQQLLQHSHHSTRQKVSLDELKKENKKLDYLPVEIRGKYDENLTFFLENQFYHHQLGLHVITPFILNEKYILLVDRGWVSPPFVFSPYGFSEHKTIHGRLKLIKKNPFIRESFEKIDSRKKLSMMQYDRVYLTQCWQKSVLPFVLLLDCQEVGGYGRDWVIAVIPPSRHQGYAVQWFSLALLSLIISLFILRSKK